MMCRASTSETSSLSGSGIFFFSSTGRVGGCAGCGGSSSSSCQEASLVTSGHPPRDRHRAPRGRTHFWKQVMPFFSYNPRALSLSWNASCLVFVPSFNYLVYDLYDFVFLAQSPDTSF